MLSVVPEQTEIRILLVRADATTSGLTRFIMPPQIAKSYAPISTTSGTHRPPLPLRFLPLRPALKARRCLLFISATRAAS